MTDLNFEPVASVVQRPFVMLIDRTISCGERDENNGGEKGNLIGSEAKDSVAEESKIARKRSDSAIFP